MACLLPQDVLNRRLLFKQTSRVLLKPSPIISSFLELGGKLSMQPKFVAAQKMLLNRNHDIRKWIARFNITLSIYTPLEARVYCSQ